MAIAMIAVNTDISGLAPTRSMTKPLIRATAIAPQAPMTVNSIATLSLCP